MSHRQVDGTTPTFTVTSIQQRTYRIPNLKASAQPTSSHLSSQRTSKRTSTTPTQETADDAAPAITSDNDHFTMRIHIAASLYSRLIGRNGETIKQIQSATNATVRIPQQQQRQTQQQRRQTDDNPSNSNDEAIVITADNRDAVMLCYKRIMELTNNKAAYTHFVSIPLTTYADRYRQWIAQLPNNFDKSILVRPETLHFTLGMLTLTNKEQVDNAVKVMSTIAPKLYELVSTRPLFVHLKGLAVMNESNAAKSHVLYVGAERDEHYEQLNDVTAMIIRTLIDGGVIGPTELQRQSFFSPDGAIDVLYHCTLANTRHKHNDMARAHATTDKTAEDDAHMQMNTNSNVEPLAVDTRHNGLQQRRSSSHYPHRTPFDARPLLSAFSNLDWGAEKIHSIELSVLGPAAASGYYQCISSIQLQ